MLVDRSQILRIAELLTDDPTIETVDIDRTEKGRITVSSIQMVPTRKQMRLTRAALPTRKE